MITPTRIAAGSSVLTTEGGTLVGLLLSGAAVSAAVNGVSIAETTDNGTGNASSVFIPLKIILKTETKLSAAGSGLVWFYFAS